MNKIIFDMDGTIANLYGVKNWLQQLDNEDTEPYAAAEPLYDMEELGSLVRKLQSKGFKIAIVSWCSKNGTKEYNQRIRRTKKEWLKKYNFPYDEIHIIKYGVNKSKYCDKDGIQILVDDDARVRENWKGLAINANYNIMEILETLG